VLAEPGPRVRYHEEQRFHGLIFAVLLAAVLIVAASTALDLLSARATDPWLLAIGPGIAVAVAILLSLSHLDIDVGDDEVRIAFRYLWPARRSRFRDIASLSVRRYHPLFEYGGWGVRLGPAGWAFNTGGDEGVQLRLRKGVSRPDRLAALA
jgi:hypothetical protein